MPIDTDLLSTTGAVDKEDVRTGLILPAAADIAALQAAAATLQEDVAALETVVGGLEDAYTVMTVSEYAGATLEADTAYSIEPAWVAATDDLPDLLDDRWDGVELTVGTEEPRIYRCLPDGEGGRSWVAIGTVSADSPTFTGTATVESLKIGDLCFLTEVDGDAYLSVNARYDGSDWLRIDVTAPAYRLQWNVANNMDFESYKACTFWIASAAANPIGAIATVGGWELAFSMSQFRDWTQGGGGTEFDGHGTVEQYGYGRYQHATISGVAKTGLLCNQYLDESGRDRPLKPSWQAGFQSDGTTDRFVISRGAGGVSWPGWTELLTLSSTGSLTVAQPLAVAQGGTAATTASAARTNLGVGTAGLSVVADNAGTVLTAGGMGDIEIPFACLITSVKGFADQSGSVSVDFLRAASGVYPPVTSLCAGAPLALSSASSATATITGWTKTLAAGDILRPVTSSISTITRLTVNITLTRT